jgi:hypothetical protein
VITDFRSRSGESTRADVHVTRIAPARNAVLCQGIQAWRASLERVKTHPAQPHRPYPVGRGWICLRCSKFERAA